MYFVAMIIVLIINYVVIYFISDDDTASGLTTLLFLILMFAPAVNCLIGNTEQEEQVVQYEITGLELETKEKENLKGFFVLGTGFVSGEKKEAPSKYVFFANTEYGKKLTTLPINGVYLRETDEENPKLIEIVVKQVRPARFIDYFWGHKKGDIIEGGKYTKGKILVVPTNTIKIDYNVEV